MPIFTVEHSQARDEWKRNLSTALTSWLDSHNYNRVDRIGFREKLLIPNRQWRGILTGEYIVGDVDVYRRLFEETKLPEADPETIPQISQEDKRKSRSGKVVVSTNSSQPNRLNRMARSLSTWCKKNGYTQKDLREELGITKGRLEYVISGQGFSNPDTMARLFWRTGIPELDPRTIPSETRGLAGSTEARNMTQEEYEIWKENWEQSVGIKSPVESMEEEFQFSSIDEEHHFRDDSDVEEETIATSVSEEMLSPPPEQTLTLGKMLDSAIAVFAQQVGRHVASEVSETVVRELQHVAEGFPTRADISSAVTEVVDAFTTPTSVPESSDNLTVTSFDTRDLIRELTQRFEALKMTDSVDRDAFVSLFSNELGDLYVAFAPFTMDTDQRERSLESERRHQ